MTLAALHAALRALPPAPGDTLPVRDVLAAQAAVLDAHAELGRALGTPGATAQELLVREHYFRTQERADAAGDREVDGRFEAAVDAIVAGERDTLARLLAEDPALLHARSPYGHRQTILHHVAANGIEFWRQWQTPQNICELARLVLDAGADPDATCEPYGHRDTTLTLLVSSCHPAEAGQQAALVKVLCDAGARPNGIDDDGTPLWTAITWGYRDAAEQLVACGARVDNLVFAAALGDLDRVVAYLDGTERAAGPLRICDYGPVLDDQHLLEYALIYAAGMGRREIVEYLLTKQPDLSVIEPIYGATALGIASYAHPAAGRPHGHPAIVALLEQHR